MKPRLIVIDGKTYHSVDEMPADIRQKYEQAIRSLGDANDDHIPDVLENVTNGHAVMNTMNIIVDGKEFNGIESLPPEARARYEEAMNKLDANRNGIPDFVEGLINTADQSADISSSFGTPAPRRAAPLPISPAITPDTSNGWPLALAGFFMLLLCVAGAAGVWYFFLR